MRGGGGIRIGEGERLLDHSMNVTLQGLDLFLVNTSDLRQHAAADGTFGGGQDGFVSRDHLKIEELPIQQAIELPNLIARGESYGAEADKFAPGVVEGLAAKGVTYVNHTFTSNLALSASMQPFAGLEDHSICEYPTTLKQVAVDQSSESRRRFDLNQYLREWRRNGENSFQRRMLRSETSPSASRTRSRSRA